LVALTDAKSQDPPFPNTPSLDLNAMDGGEAGENDLHYLCSANMTYGIFQAVIFSNLYSW